MKIMNLIITAMIALTAGACANSSNNPSPEAPQFKSFLEQEFLLDLDNVINSENALLGVGLVFESESTTKDGAVIYTYHWNEIVYVEYHKQDPSTALKVRSQALGNYKTVAEAFLSKYEGQFNLKKNDGSVERYKIKDDFYTKLKAKISLASKTIEALRKGNSP